MRASLPANEPERLKILHEYGILDTEPEENLDDLTFLASQICDTPIALISLIDAERQWFKARVGTDEVETSRDNSFCAHAILNPDDLTVVRDTTTDPRFADNPLVTDPAGPGIRFYASSPLVTPEGAALGTLCVLDRIPRTLTADQLKALRIISHQVLSELKLRRGAQQVVDAVTARDQAEQARQSTEARLARLTANIPGMVYQFLLKPDGLMSFPYVSGGCRELFALEPAVIMADATSLTNIIVAEDQPGFVASVGLSAQTLEPWKWQGRFTLADGAIRWIDGASRPTAQPDGSILWDGLLMDITQLKQTEIALRVSEAHSREEVIRAQAESLAELSTPLIPVLDHCVVLPLVGSIDSRRAQQVMETLLQGVEEHKARIAIIDITGVAIVDTQVASALIKTAQAVQLLGAEVFITGIRPEIAQTLVGLGIQLQGIRTLTNLQMAISVALNMLTHQKSARKHSA